MFWKNSIISFVILSVLCISTAFYQVETYQENESVKIYAVMNILERAHFSPEEINDDFSARFFDTYLERLDYGKRFFLQSEVDELKAYRLQLDDQLEARTTEFFDASLAMLESGIERGEEIVQDIVKTPFDYEMNEEIERDYDKLTFAKNDSELREIWRKSLKYETLNKLRSKMDSQEENASEEEKKSMAELEKESREEVKENYEDWFDRLDKLRRSDRFGDYLNTMTNLFDPHSDYYSPKQKEDFDINMGRSLEGIGARLRQEGDYVTVASIVPGGPAWKEGSLEVEDAIIKVAQEGEDPVNTVGMRIDDAVQLIRGKKGTKVILTVRKVNDNEEEIVIERDKVILDEGKVRSAILDHTGIMEDIGYIHLPRFYADFDDPEGNSCADDVAEELEKLKASNVNGIILDLRNNGGGSLRDVVEMSGLFIKEGPIVQVKSKDKKAHVYKDQDPEIQYDGPLVILVNQNSASASEIIAAALQDYNRAVIVGSSSTFGKGTVQRFIDLDRYVRGDEYKPLGELKVTMQKFYRINGGSTQLKGVEPDILIPDSYMLLETGEKELDHALPWTEIEALEYENTVGVITDMDDLRQKSEARISHSEEFKKVEDNAARLKRLQEETTYSLNLEEYDAEMDLRDEENEHYKNIFSEIPDLTVENLEMDLEYINSDTSRMERNNRWLKNVRKDHYIEEAMYIIRDLSFDATSSVEEK